MKVLVTGATGFLGSALRRALERNGDEVVALSSADSDLTRPDSLHPWDRYAFERIYHLATWTQAGDFCLRHPGEQWVINQQIHTNLLAWWQQRQPQAYLVAVGSSCAYDPTLELVEENFLSGVPTESLLAYAMTKRMLYVGLAALRKQFGLRSLCAVPATLYGPGPHRPGRQSHFVFDVIRKVVLGKRHGEPVVLWGDGHQRRELIYVDDFVSALLRLAGSDDVDLVNVGHGEDFTIREFASLVCRHVGYDFNDVQYDTGRYVGARAKCLRTDRLRRVLPDLRLTPLSEGLPRTIDDTIAPLDRHAERPVA
jgi:GDP-L-fucose synthase